MTQGATGRRGGSSVCAATSPTQPAAGSLSALPHAAQLPICAALVGRPRLAARLVVRHNVHGAAAGRRRRGDDLQQLRLQLRARLHDTGAEEEGRRGFDGDVHHTKGAGKPAAATKNATAAANHKLQSQHKPIKAAAHLHHVVVALRGHHRLQVLAHKLKAHALELPRVVLLRQRQRGGHRVNLQIRLRHKRSGAEQ